jgi:hypothetical protein
LKVPPRNVLKATIFVSKTVQFWVVGNIVQRTILFGDGAGDLSSPISQKDFCHVYGAIGTFSPVIEVKDTFGCMSRKVISNAVTVAPDVYPKFKVIVQQQGCGFIRILFVNESYTQQADVKNYKWIFGDGDSVCKQFMGQRHSYLHR